MLLLLWLSEKLQRGLNIYKLCYTSGNHFSQLYHHCNSFLFILFFSLVIASCWISIDPFCCWLEQLTMPAKNRFVRLDAFTKTVEDARVRTTSGGVVTIVSLLVIFWLTWGEWSDYRRIVVRPELVVDKGRGKLLSQSQ